MKIYVDIDPIPPVILFEQMGGTAEYFEIYKRVLEIEQLLPLRDTMFAHQLYLAKKEYHAMQKLEQLLLNPAVDAKRPFVDVLAVAERGSFDMHIFHVTNDDYSGKIPMEWKYLSNVIDVMEERYPNIHVNIRGMHYG